MSEEWSRGTPNNALWPTRAYQSTYMQAYIHIHHAHTENTSHITSQVYLIHTHTLFSFSPHLKCMLKGNKNFSHTLHGYILNTWFSYPWNKETKQSGRVMKWHGSVAHALGPFTDRPTLPDVKTGQLSVDAYIPLSPHIPEYKHIHASK